MGVQRYRNLFSSLKDISSKKSGKDSVCNILEVGVYKGVHGREMIAKCLSLGMIPVYYGFDLFDDLDEQTRIKENSKPDIPPPKDQILRAMRARFPGVSVHLFQGDTKETLPKHAPKLPIMDLIFLDGGHSEETFESDWKQCSKLIGDKTVVILDDYYRNKPDSNPRKSIDRIISDDSYVYTFLPPIDVVDDREICMVKLTK